MKKILSLLVLLLAMGASTFAAEKIIWEGSQQISWNTDYFPGIQLDTYNEEGFKTIFTGLAKDDIIRLYTTSEYDSPYYAIKYKDGSDWSWTDLEFTTTNGVLSYTVASDDMATWIAERGLVITGQAYTLTKITIETPSGEGGSTETDLSVQEGSSPLPLTLLSDWSAYTTFAASQFANAKAGDVITVYVQDVEEGAQISLKDMSDGWPALDESTQYPSVATTDTKFVYTLTEESAAKVKTYGLVIGGQKLTVTRVTLTTTSSVDPDPEPTEGVTYTAWTGETVFGNTWSVWQQVEASAFANAKENMILRVKFKDLKAGAQLQMSDGSWTVLPGVEVVNISGVYQDYTITAERLAVLQEKGLIISGTSFTLTSVEVINPADLKPLTLSVPVTNNWVYSNAPAFTIHVENPYNEAVTANAVIAIATDKLAPVTSITKTVDVAANSTEDIVLTCTDNLEAGIYHATATVNDDLARSFFFAMNPTSIVSAPDKQSDFDSYWTAAREQLTAVEDADEPVLTEIPSKSGEKRKVYLVEFKSVPDGTSGDPVTIRGYYAEPTDGKRHPVIMHYLGYDSGYRPGGQDVKPYCPNGDDDNSDYAEFYLSARGQSINNRAADEREADGKGDFTNTYGDWFAFNFGQKDSYYYRGAYMDQVRAIDFMATRKTSDMDNLFAEGQSQGGAFTVAAAALSGYTFKAIAPAITFMGDFPDYFDIVSWPAYVARENQGTMTDEEMFAFLSYYDTKNLATKIACPIITSVGLQDNVCPAHTNLAPYNNVTTEAGNKQIVYNPELQHQVANDWFTTYMTFFKNYQTESINSYSFTTDVSPKECGTVTVKIGDETGEVTTETTFDVGTQLTVIAEAKNGYQFVQWQNANGEVVATTATLTVTIDANEAYTAIFEAQATALAEEECRTLYENLDGQTMSWNEICVKDAAWGAILEKNEEIQVTVSAKDATTEWPKVILRDADSEEVSNVLLNDVSEFPYVAKFILTTDDLTKLANGFKISGDGVTITKVALYKPTPVLPVFDENGKADLSRFVSDGSAAYVYADGKGTITTGEETYKGAYLSLGSDDYVSGTKLIVKFEESTQAQIHVNYVDGTWADGAQITATGTELVVPLDASKQVNRIDIQIVNANTTAVLTEVAISNKCILTTAVTDGTIEVKAGDEVTTETEFDYGTKLTLTATTTNADLVFKQWVVGETTITDNPYTFTITSDITVTAEFRSADPNVIWLGNTTIDWNSAASQSITVTAEDNLKIADCLVMTITPSIENIDWPQVQMSSLNGWGLLIGSSNVAIDDNTKEVRFMVTKQMLADITANGGFGVSGVGFTLKKVTIERGNSEGYENAIWIGEKEFGSNWSVYQTISKACFADAKAGDVLRIKYKNVKAGAALTLSYTTYNPEENQNNWSTLPGTSGMTPNGISTKIILTEEMLTAIRTASDIEGHTGLGDLHISGINFTLTSVDLLDASDVKDLTCSVPVTGDDWIWNTGETPTFTVNIQNENAEAVTANATLMLATDKMVAIKNYESSKEVAANSNDAITFEITETLASGFYHATMIVNEETVRGFNFGYAPTEISSPADKQADFESFWKAAKDELAAIEATDEPVLTKIESKSSEKRTVYLVEFKSVSNGDGIPETVRGYYAEPNDGKKHPVIMHYQGYDSGYRPGGQDVEPWCLSGDADELSANYAEFVLSTRGQSVNNRPTSERADGIDRDFTNTYGDWFAYNFGDKDKYYYRGAYMDVVRAIDFMATRPTSDMTNLYAEGQSQGGAFSYAAAALSGYEFKAIAPGIAFMGDFPDYFELASWPASVARENQGTMTDEEMYAFLSYFDTKNLATLISNKTAVIATIGVQDNVCPPHTNIAPYNNLPDGTVKEISFNPENAHQVAANWYDVYMAYFKSKYVEPQPEPQPVTPVFDENGIADLSKMEVQDAEKVTYDVETHTVTTTEGWTGVQLTVTDGEEVSGKELRITFDREMAVKCYVKYVDETDADVIMDKAEKILYYTLDETKKLYQVQIQPTDAATFAFEEIKVNQESTKPEPEPEPEPVEKTRTENAQKLLDVLTSLYGNKIISGTTAVVDWNTSQAEQVHQWTNKYPAINTYDFINIHASKDINPEGWLDYSDISGVKNWAAEGGVVSAMWHWQVKNNAGTGYTCTQGTGDAATSFDASKVYVDGTAENILAKQQLSQVCGYLKKMQDAGIPVIWRPLHEAAGNTYEYDGGTAWFWWGAKGADVYKQLWQWMYNYMVNEQGLNNLIWVWTSQTKDGSWYPGNDYVDIIGRDIYGGQATQHKNDFDHLTAGYPNMMAALSECGNTSNVNQSDISAVWETGAKWSWFSTWYDSAGSQLHNTQSWWTNAFSQDYVVTREQMKELLDLKIEPDPEPQPEPDTNTFDENGIADLSKIEVQDAEKVTYDVETHTVTTTAGWTGVQLTIADGEQVSGKELRITFDRAIKVKCYVKYMDETDADVIMDDAAEILYFELDNTKKLYQVQIQPTETATFAFNEICVNAESTKPVLKPLEEGETRILFEDEEGIVMNWNEICQMAAEWGAILEAGENFLVTVKSRTEGSEWPKVILRDASSTAVNEVELADVTDYPHIVKIKLTDTMINQLKDGFRFSGDGVTITKIELNKPAPAKDGDISVEAMNWFRTSIYDADAYTVTTTARWGQAGWAIGDDRYAEKTLIIVNIEPTSFPVTLKVEYINTDDKTLANSVGIDAGNTELYLPIPLDTKTIKKVYVTYREAGSLVLTDASIIAAANARPLTGNEGEATEINTLDNLTNSQVDNAPMYNLAGQRVYVVGKGVYIQNGKKKVIK